MRHVLVCRSAEHGALPHGISSANLTFLPFIGGFPKCSPAPWMGHQRQHLAIPKVFLKLQSAQPPFAWPQPAATSRNQPQPANPLSLRRANKSQLVAPRISSPRLSSSDHVLSIPGSSCEHHVKSPFTNSTYQRGSTPCIPKDHVIISYPKYHQKSSAAYHSAAYHSTSPQGPHHHLALLSPVTTQRNSTFMTCPEVTNSFQKTWLEVTTCINFIDLHSSIDHFVFHRLFFVHFNFPNRHHFHQPQTLAFPISPTKSRKIRKSTAGKLGKLGVDSAEAVSCLILNFLFVV